MSSEIDIDTDIQIQVQSCDCQKRCQGNSKGKVLYFQKIVLEHLDIHMEQNEP